MSTVRKQVFITAEQDRRLKDIAVSTGQAEAVIVRRGIDLVLSGAQLPEDWRSVLDTFLEDADTFEDLAKRVEESKRVQRERTRVRNKATRRRLGDT